MPVLAEESRVIETGNSFGGKTVEITGFDGKESVMGNRWDQYLVEQKGDLVVYGATRLKRKLTRLVNYYNAGGTVMKDTIEYDPECEYSRTLHIVSETNTYPAREKDKGYTALTKEVLFDKATTRETGMVSCSIFIRSVLLPSRQPPLHNTPV
jgi:hypothetical protein